MYDLKDINSLITISEVPESWVYKHFYNKLSGIVISQKFDGRIIKVKSLKNRDTVPSLCFFYKNGHYYWKDFSNGEGGSIVRFVSYHMSKYESLTKSVICSEYQTYLSTAYNPDYEEELPDVITRPTFAIVTDTYNEECLGFWGQFKIDIDCLNKFKMRRGIRYKMTKEEKEYIFDFNKQFFYAYYNSEGCYQLYQPDNKNAKYININTSYLIGSEQLEHKYDTCMIISGLKDIAAISMIKELKCEYVAPPSENCLISKQNIEKLKSEYKFVFSMLDNDDAGLRAMNLYKKVYQIPYIHVKLKKDLADNNKHYPLEKLKYSYTELIQKKMQNYGSTD